MKGRDGSGPSSGVRLVLGAGYALTAFLPLVAAMAAPTWRREDAFAQLTSSVILLVSSLLSLQPVLAARFTLLDRQFGLDIVYVFHKTMGMTVALLQAVALAFFLADPDRAVPAPAWAASALIAVLAVTSLLRRELGQSYESWRRLHNMLFLAVSALAVLQAGAVARRLGSHPLAVVIVLQTAMAAAAYLQHRFLGPAARRAGLYRVKSVVEEARNVWTLTFGSPEGGRRFEFLPGQFQFITFGGGRGEEHPFTISSSPMDRGSHTATIKGSGDFTRTIGSVRPGDAVGIQAAFGRFSHVLAAGEPRLVFIAGGIGITPFMSMLRYMRETGEDRDVALFYANRSEEDIVFQDELDRIAAANPPRLRVVHVLNAPGSAWHGERGRIDMPLLEHHLPDLRSRLFYLCGPPAMMSALAAMLMDAGVPSRRIRTERFAL